MLLPALGHLRHLAEDPINGTTVSTDVIVSTQRCHQMQQPALLRADLEVLEKFDPVELPTGQRRTGQLATFVVGVGRRQRRVDGDDVDVVDAEVAVVAEHVTTAGSFGPVSQSSNFCVSFAQSLNDGYSEILDGTQENL